MTMLEKKYSDLLNTIGTARLLDLPSGVKEILQNTTDLEVKVQMLEEVAKAMGERV